MPVLDAAVAADGPVVVGGDFNTANMKWIWNLLPIPFGGRDSHRVQEAFRARGFTSPFEGGDGTLDVLWLSLHLDWIFPRTLRALASGIRQVPFSDHDAVWVELAGPERLGETVSVGESAVPSRR
jgi:endonuclease/exonuclease/phosphatase (EEP) superfamily protein YafD